MGRMIWSVHPRVCGEHPPSSTAAGSGTGSSPRVRGTPLKRRVPNRGHRFIPACAGNTWANDKGVSSEDGSSPRVRGTPLEVIRNTAVRPVHPRVCGEHAPRGAGRVSGAGSSPRVRGTLQGCLDRQNDLRFIPACAGNTRR